jgi:hypothetical protein
MSEMMSNECSTVIGAVVAKEFIPISPMDPLLEIIFPSSMGNIWASAVVSGISDMVIGSQSRGK